MEQEEKSEYRTIGEESGDALRLLLTNQTGSEITGLSVKASSGEEASENLLGEDMKIGIEETICMYYTPGKADSEQGEKVRTTYDISLSYEDGRVVEITGLELDDMEKAELCFEEEVGFVKYTSADSGKEISTKETALALRAQQQAKAAAEKQKKAEAEAAAAEQAKKDAQAAAAAQAQAETAAQTQYEQQYYEQPVYQEPVYEEPVYQEPVYEEPVYQEPVYEEPVYQEPVYEEPVYEEPADSGGQNQDVSQSGEGCLGGQGVLRY
ncbi:hypothetical protein [Schaedlerella arabinosiphila]|uniref:hypothetical protein n=1 Tax=Schaedlerella arabinosiphila TaxID=2044587 RepID=UPI002557F782|nr:hypothetical protein [Schaedlerella arabinosiphila]